MSKAKLRWYLEKIKVGDPVDVTAFKRCLPESIAGNIRGYFEIKPVSSKKCILTSVRPEVFDDLWERSGVSNTRTEASFKGDSHAKGTSRAYLMLFTHQGDPEVPEVVVVCDDSNISPGNLQSRVLLIENEENFAEYQKMLALASDWLGSTLSIENTDVILAAGNRVNKSIIRNWLRDTYDQVYCMFDYDLGGLRIFETMAKTVPSAIFVQPDDWSRYEHCFRKDPRGVKDYHEAKDKAIRLGFWGLHEAFVKNLKFMEQETLLIEEDDE